MTGSARGRPRTAETGRIAWLTTLLKGRPRQHRDLCWQQRQAQAPELWLVIVDASASTRRNQALTQAKGLLAGLFDEAYRQRARLALLTVSGDKPQWQLHGLKASAALQPWLQGLGAGGGTPLPTALEEARQWLLARSKRLPLETQRCLVLTDGRLLQEAPMQPLPCSTLLVDMERAAVRVGRARQLAEQLHAEYRHIEQFSVVD
ncbi:MULTISPECIES: vWA domain-containing protein [Pseudomonas]|uniref:VWA domain-containing protein n=1 Tax=Pseudomonas soli TaxID=1306993 RepID=A0AAJ5SUZ0_9PSED|nr:MULTISPECIES: VWA domain-containing protein [Pseudomonas]AUY31705.1 VWA domain-containing protein [Pseudomonas sp. PONIH3]MCX5509731.1 VWA domain-containing protein [Pseudomonas sp. BJa3]MDT3717364.1 VWA domain-containing protein [Pseudomonas soli]MDT3734096.1 VWA domain-containing protein [Pseudomonas soli]MDW9405562.1 VWA domain-containing protein [Pseudomonas soli]